MLVDPLPLQHGALIETREEYCVQGVYSWPVKLEAEKKSCGNGMKKPGCPTHA